MLFCTGLASASLDLGIGLHAVTNATTPKTAIAKRRAQWIDARRSCTNLEVKGDGLRAIRKSPLNKKGRAGGGINQLALSASGMRSVALMLRSGVFGAITFRG